MERHERYGQPLPLVTASFRDALLASLGPPVYADRYIEVFDLKSGAPD